MKFYTLLAFIALLITGCDNGLTPGKIVSPGFGGFIRCLSDIPSGDSLFDIRVAAIPYDPRDSSVYSIFRDVFSGVISFSPQELTLQSKGVIEYTLFTDPKVFRYVGIVYQFSDSIFAWKVLGFYGFSGPNTTPLELEVPPGKFIHGVNFDVDFNNLPPQPFKTP